MPKRTGRVLTPEDQAFVNEVHEELAEGRMQPTPAALRSKRWIDKTKDPIGLGPDGKLLVEDPEPET